MQAIVTIALDALIFASYLFIVSVGLTIIFGVMKILNVAHGSFYAWGAYTAAFFISRFGEAGWSAWWGYASIFISAALVGSVLGVIIERGILRFLYQRDEVLIVLATFGTFLILEDLLLLVFGITPYFAYQPMMLFGSSDIAGIYRDNYSLSLIVLASNIALFCWLALHYSRWGKLLNAVIYDREISEAMGINVNALYLITFILGATLGALGGAYLAPTISVAPGLGTEVIVLSFAVVVIGGLGSIPGTLIGALFVGLLRAIAIHYFPQLELFVIYAVMALVLIIRPEGLFIPVSIRKI